MGKRKIKQVIAVFLAITIAFFGGDTVFASGEAEKEVIVVTPFEGQWKYYGQTKTFRAEENYSLSSEEEELPAWELGIESEEVGQQPFVLKGTVEDEEKKMELDPKAPAFEVKAYTTTAEAEVDPEIRTSKDPITLEAPEGYLISAGKTADDTWAEGLEISTLEEGTNVITYYLRSNQNNSTRKAIDQTPKTVTIEVDTTAPSITEIHGGDNCTDVTAEGSIAGSEPGKFYYLAAPADYAEDITIEDVKKYVKYNYGIVGYGQVDGVNSTPLNIKGLMADSTYRIYAYMVDEAGLESELVISDEFVTDKMSLSGEVEISGTAAVDSTLTATPQIDSVYPGDLTYQWYRIQVAGDEKERDEIVDETGGAAEDDLEAEDDGEDEEDEDSEDEDEEDEDEDDLVTLSQTKKLEEDEEEITTVDGAQQIEGATSATYKVTKKDIGYHLIVSVRAANYSGYIAGSTASFVPKLMPKLTLPVLGAATYSPTRRLSSIRLPQRWSWVDASIVPVHGNSGYRAKYIPVESAVYKTVIVRVPVPVNRKNITKGMVTVSKKRAYTGASIKNNFTVKDQSKKLQSGKDFRVSYKNNKNPGTAKITFTGMGNYAGSVKATYKIVKRSLKSVTCRYKKAKYYTGKKRKPGLSLKNGSVKLKKNRDYTVEYKKNKEIGRASLIVRGKGNYRGKRTLHFSIVPRKASIRKTVRKKKGFQLTLSSKKESRGYYIQVSSTRSFKGGQTQAYVTPDDHFGIRGLQKGSTWYVRVRSYVVKKGKTYSSAYSKIKKIKTK